MPSILENLSSGLRGAGQTLLSGYEAVRPYIANQMGVIAQAASPTVYDRYTRERMNAQELEAQKARMQADEENQYKRMIIQGTITAMESGALAPEKGQAVLRRFGAPAELAIGPNAAAQDRMRKEQEAMQLEKDLKDADLAAFEAMGARTRGNASATVAPSADVELSVGGDVKAPAVQVAGDSRFGNSPEYYDAFAEQLLQRGRRKEALDAENTARQLREKRIPKSLPGMPYVLWDEKTQQYKEDPKLREQYLKDAEAKATRVDVAVKNEEAYGKTLGAKVAEQDVALKSSAENAPMLADRANTALRILDSGQVITGAGADIRLAFAKAAKALGVNDPSVANTEQLASSLAENTLDAIKASNLGGGNGFSNADREFLEKAKGGSIKLDGESLRRIITLAHRAAEQSAKKWNARLQKMPKSAIEGAGLDTTPIEVPKLYQKDDVKLTPQGQGAFDKYKAK